MTERDVQELAANFFRGKSHRLIVPNCKAFNRREADLLTVTPSDLVHEVEVKTDRSDFDRDFTGKRSKHESMRESYASGDWKHGGPNYFWFAVPEGLVPLDAVPEYAGLMYITGGPSDHPGDRVKVVRKAPRLHSDKISERARRYLARGITIRYWNQTSTFGRKKLWKKTRR